jgi:predicted nucleic acid-binding protein
LIILDTDYVTLLAHGGADGTTLRALLADRVQQLRKSHLRVGTMDLKIAAIVLARDATLLSRNVRDFKGIPGLRVDNWLNGR